MGVSVCLDVVSSKNIPPIKRWRRRQQPNQRRIQAICAYGLEHIIGLPAGIKGCDQSQSMLNNDLFQGYESQQLKKGEERKGISACTGTVIAL
jgi:hypothetical protein